MSHKLALSLLFLVVSGSLTTSEALQSILSTSTFSTGTTITIDLANLPQDLPGIRDCRSTVGFAKQPRLLASQKSFLNATALTNPKLDIVCVVARGPEGTILGTTDCRIGSSDVIVNNVFVRPDHRGSGIGERMIKEGVEQLVVPMTTKSKLTLNVDTSNKAAVRLYEKCGFQISDPANAFVYFLAQWTGADLQIIMSKQMD